MGPRKPHFGTPLTRIVSSAPYGAFSKVPVPGPQCVPRHNFGGLGLAPKLDCTAPPPKGGAFMDIEGGCEGEGDTHETSLGLLDHMVVR